jgi:hypothetical protein
MRKEYRGRPRKQQLISYEPLVLVGRLVTPAELQRIRAVWLGQDYRAHAHRGGKSLADFQGLSDLEIAVADDLAVVCVGARSTGH